ncbi:peroxisomal membrane protein 11 [Chloropicon primus]|uniref:Peroxisomal membrane protein 11 n=1 Tax=Chloropicon primus TaxID=1764295 RepID=A0A5B8N033_9CHLO|nr:peroxisomal membrane protein 11 [Chloropicon primus]UPR04833.1 peroxisomal membrane protein 11 [Chloropicon primus]|mmetsp:Transcript_3298/g.9198  ORF Transcript_3298/g.9198 Transcript_3298/m.9198 type:complete len:247 (-) Transcript_3298:44-784(-)|eukprot:QDZ25636.1 peroxisomal membrane protein 11 [Chloropicon primus]
MGRTEENLNTMKQFLAKSDGRDKLCATIQYALMFIHAGQAGKVKKVQGQVASARKVFRVMKPVETLAPMITDPFGTKALAKTDDPKIMFLVKRAQMLLMALYFGGDHVVWAKSAGIIEDAETATLAKKVSMYSWFGGSICKALNEMFELSKLVSNTNTKLKSLQDKDGEEVDEERRETRAKADAMALKRTFTVCHAFIQATLALGLADALPLKPRTLGFLGVTASVMNIYLLLPGSFKPQLKAKRG